MKDNIEPTTELPKYRREGTVLRDVTVHFEDYPGEATYSREAYEGTVVLLPNGYVDLRRPSVEQLIPPHRINTIDYSGGSEK